MIVNDFSSYISQCCISSYSSYIVLYRVVNFIFRVIRFFKLYFAILVSYLAMYLRNIDEVTNFFGHS